MALIRMALAGYRCFAERQDIELRPVTVVLGRNNSGKSALVRAPLVCDTGIRTNSPAPLDLDVLGEGILESFTDLVYANRPHGSVEIGLEFDGVPTPTSLTVRVQHIEEYQTQVVSALRMRTGDLVTTADWEPGDPPEAIRYTVRSGEQAIGGLRLAFRGLLPSGVPTVPTLPGGAAPGPPVTRLLAAARAVRDNYPAVRYLGPFRERAARRYRLPARMPTDVGTGGERVASILADDAARRQGRLAREVNRGLADNLPGWQVGAVERGGMYSVILTSRDNQGLRVNLADAGTGVAQALPIFVQRALDGLDPPRGPVLEIVEQPELHLHPAAHGALADLYLCATRQTGVRFVLETHSETLLLRLRRRIAEGLDPDTVAIYFVEHGDGAARARRIEIDRDGDLDYWPTGVFTEDYEETQALAVAQLRRRDTGAR
ncbi:MAG TPA: DUF3696 domain-containing protein [Mycobacteriales bacterium]|nr:DUF3696 domain-containing protein [Mycobacteriales bacterium]